MERDSNGTENECYCCKDDCYFLQQFGYLAKPPIDECCNKKQNVKKETNLRDGESLDCDFANWKTISMDDVKQNVSIANSVEQQLRRLSVPLGPWKEVEAMAVMMEEVTLGSSVATSFNPKFLPVFAYSDGLFCFGSLVDCARAIEDRDLKLADSLLEQIWTLAAYKPNEQQSKVVKYFAEALVRRAYGLHLDSDNFKLQMGHPLDFLNMLGLHFDIANSVEQQFQRLSVPLGPWEEVVAAAMMTEEIALGHYL
ncbi:uncharacterized protein LOC111279407 [Durio zibethinus]|uniref:Uncharacterized protein LOC111279407 n=1 Tax=Durio zibethinus TaxID=66656 RepID=A0A6P5X2Q7_DURZI|nr:uncharacterized protein LOC111279407 [Durio zibethinus]